MLVVLNISKNTARCFCDGLEVCEVFGDDRTTILKKISLLGWRKTGKWRNYKDQNLKEAYFYKPTTQKAL